MIRALEHARVTMSIEVESAPTVLHVFEHEDSKFILFGTVDGRIGLLDFDRYKLNFLQDFIYFLIVF